MHRQKQLAVSGLGEKGREILTGAAVRHSPRPVRAQVFHRPRRHRPERRGLEQPHLVVVEAVGEHGGRVDQLKREGDSSVRASCSTRYRSNTTENLLTEPPCFNNQACSQVA